MPPSSGYLEEEFFKDEEGYSGLFRNFCKLYQFLEPNFRYSYLDSAFTHSLHTQYLNLEPMPHFN